MLAAMLINLIVVMCFATSIERLLPTALFFLTMWSAVVTIELVLSNPPVTDPSTILTTFAYTFAAFTAVFTTVYFIARKVRAR